MKSFSSLSSSSSSLTSGGVVLDKYLKELYQSLGEDEKKIFLKVFHGVHNHYNYVRAFARENNTLNYYFLVYNFCRAQKLEGYELAVLSKFWLLSDAGKNGVNFHALKLRRFERPVITKFSNLNYFLLTRYDPAYPYLIPSLRPSWLSWTGAGVRYYNNLIAKFRIEVRNFHLDIITK